MIFTYLRIHVEDARGCLKLFYEIYFRDAILVNISPLRTSVMKVIFLDVDGVLNSAGLLYHYGFDYLDEDMVSLFSWVVERTGSEVVLSSSWRKHERATRLVSEALARYGVVIMDKTPSFDLGPRSNEISDWLSRHAEVEKYAILDDNSEAGIGMEHGFFKTDLEVGLDEATAGRLIRYLKAS